MGKVKDLLQPPGPDWWWAYYGVAWAIFGLAIAVVWFIVAILIAVWVYRDAEKRGESGVLWLIIVLITGIIGLIIWLIIRRDKPVTS
jgi:uncharacterized membrane protein YoaK (UPF0700 family)